MHFNELIEVLGEFGRYQKIRFILICFVSTICAFHAMNMVFVGAKPEKKCVVPNVNISSVRITNLSRERLADLVRGADSDGACYLYDSSEIFSLLSNKNFKENELMSVISDANHSLSKVECSDWTFSRDVYGPTIVTQFHLVCKSAWLRSTSKTLYFFGRLLGAVVFGQLSDIVGRRPMFFTGLLMLLIVGCVAAGSPNMYVFIPFYILQGAAQTGLFLVAFTMCTELVGLNYRLLTGFVIQIFYAFGQIILSGLAYLIYDWRFIEVAITVPVILFSFYLCVLPESIRWLLSKGRDEDAKAIIRKVAATNKVTVTDDMMANLSGKDRADLAAEERKYTIIDLFRTLKMFTLSINVIFNWFVNSLVYYGLSLGTDNLGGNPYINFLIAGAVEIPAYVLCILFLNRLGRRKPLAFTMVLGGAGCVASGFITKGDVELKVTLAMIAKFGITASYAIIYLLTAEVFPTVVRNIGMGVSSMTARIGGMLAPQILELNTFWSPLPSLIFGILSVIAGLLGLLLPEPTGKPLPQLIEDITDPDTKQPQTGSSSEKAWSENYTEDTYM